MHLPRRTALAALLIALAVVAAGCGGGSEAIDGRTVFLEAGCGQCHTFALAGTHAEIGPDLAWSTLDKPGLEQRIRSGGGPMPGYEFELDPEQISAVADFLLAGREEAG